jgi:hypothetical protein
VPSVPEYRLRIARLRHHGGVDVENAAFDAITIESAVAQAKELTERFLGDQPGVATLTSTAWGLVWSHRHNMPEPPRP